MSIHSHLYRADDPATSRQAASNVRKFLATHEGRILAMLRAVMNNEPPLYNGMTYRDIAHALSMEPVAVGRRLRDLERKGLVWRRVVPAMDTEHGDYQQRNGMCIWWASR